ncbi:MAG: TonB-dependent receptor [Porticoccaceae bacterium]
MGFIQKQSVLLFSLVACTAVSYAQSPTASSSARGLEEIIVTAQRRAQNLQDVPIAVSAITSSVAEKIGVIDISSMKQMVPGFTFNRQGAGAQPFVRGVGNPSTVIGNEPSVALYVDDQYLPTSYAAIYEFNNIDSIEVLKGPQGTLFGRNATGGVVHVHTRNPTHETTASVDIGLANHDTTKVQFYGSTGLTDTVAVNLAGYYKDQADGWGTNVMTGDDLQTEESWGVRGKMLIEPDDSLSILLSASHNDIESDIGMAHRVVMGYYGRDGIRPEDAGAGFYDGNTPNNQYYTVEFSSLSAKVSKDFDHLRLVSITGYANAETYNDYDISASHNAFLVANYSQDSESWTQEFQVLSPEDALVDWIVGGYYLHEVADYRAIYSGAAFGGVNQQTGDGTGTTDSYSAFAQATFEMVPDMNMTIGLRYTRDERELSEAGGTFGPLGGAPVVIAGPFSSNESFTSVTGRFSIDYQFTEDFMGYIAYNRGFKSGVYSLGSYNSSSAGPLDPVEPEELNAYSIGFKSTWADNRVRLNAEAFFYDYSNIQVQNNLPTGGGSRIVNGGEATIQGVEADLTLNPVDNLVLSAGFVALDSEYDSFKTGPTYFPLPPNDQIAIPSGCAFSTYPTGAGPSAERGCDLDGNELLQAIPFTSTLSAIYTIPTDVGFFDLALSWAYTDDYFFEPHNEKWVQQDAFSLVNASVKWTAPNEKFDVRIWGNNLTDEEYYAYMANSATSGPKGAPAAPLTYGITLGLRY